MSEINWGERTRLTKWLPDSLDRVFDDLERLEELTENADLKAAIAAVAEPLATVMVEVTRQRRADERDAERRLQLEHAAKQRDGESDEDWQARIKLWGLDGE